MPAKTTRRGALQTIASLPVLGAREQEHPHAPLPSRPYVPKVFSAAELAEFAEWAELMLPGAKAAGVAEALDFDSRSRPETAKRWRAALEWFSKAARRESRAAVLDRISHETGGDGARCFKLLKDTAIDLYYSTRAGLQGELEWNGNTYLAEFKGCGHPEHQG